MSGLTESERRGALVLALLVTLGTLQDLWWARRVALTDQPGPEVDTVAVVPAGATVPPSADPAIVDLATADVAALDALPGIGPVLAERIVTERRRVGGFHRVDDLLAVPGIGPRLLERLRPRLRVGSGGR